MTLAMAACIEFPEFRGRAGFRIYKVSGVKIEAGCNEFTARAEIVLPRNVSVFKFREVGDVFQINDPVVIRLGYGDGELPVEFVGYLSDVAEGVPILLKCENEMRKLKDGNVSVSSPNISLRTLLEKIAPGYTIDCVEMQLGAVRYANMTPISILENLKNEIGLQTYFEATGKILRCGVLYGDQSDTLPIPISLERNSVSESINKKTQASMKVSIEAISILKNGKKISIEVGDKGGTKVKRTYINIEALDDLKLRATEDIEKYKRQGFDGTITLFGIPIFEHGKKIKLSSAFYQNIEGTFLVEKVAKEFTSDGYRQVVTLGNKVS